MGKPVYRYYSTLDSGPQAPVGLDYLPITQTAIAVWCENSGDAYTIEVTLDDLNPEEQGGAAGANSANPRWFPLAEFDDVTGSNYATIFAPWLFLRINIEQASGDIELKVQQAWNNGPRG